MLRKPKRLGSAECSCLSLQSWSRPSFLLFVFILIALGTNWLLIKQCWPGTWNYLVGGTRLPDPSWPLRLWHESLLSHTPFRFLVLARCLIAFLTLILGRLINTNTFSLQYMWRNRIIRAYLGASRKVRCPDPFTGFDTYDNLYMSELRSQPAEVS